MTEKDQAIRLLNDMRVRWLDAADGYRTAGIIYADQLLRDATDEIDSVRAVLAAAKPKLVGCCDGKCTGACDGNPSTAWRADVVTDEMVKRLRKILKERWSFHIGAGAARDAHTAALGDGKDNLGAPHVEQE